MTEVVIVEDERLTAERLRSLVLSCEKDISVSAMLPSVNKAIEWFRDNSPPDLIFFDVQLSDGTCFDVLKNLNPSPPVIFTTAYHEYAMKAFKFNSIDYLLKPIDKGELQQALTKFKSLNPTHFSLHDADYKKLNNIISNNHKRRFLVKLGDQYRNVDVQDIGFFQYEGTSTYLVTFNGKKLPVDYSLDQLEELLNPMDFFRVNRQFLVHINAISQINSYFNSRLILTLSSSTTPEVIVSRNRVPDFKKWMDS